MRETPRSRFHDRIGFGKNLIEHLFVLILDLFLEFIHLVVYLLTFVDRCRFDRGFELGDAGFFIGHSCLQFIHERPRMRTEFVVRKGVNLLVRRFDLVNYRLYGTHIFLRLVTEQFRNNF